MNNQNKTFAIDLNSLKSQGKDRSNVTVEQIDRIGEAYGFNDRKQVKRRGRNPSPRTGQIHAKVFPDISIEIANEAKRRGTQQGVIIEEAWELYKIQKDIK